MYTFLAFAIFFRKYNAFPVNWPFALTPIFVWMFTFLVLAYLQCFDAVGWAVGKAAGLEKTEWWGAGVVICLERSADFHMAQPVPLPLTVSCFSKIQIGFTFLVPAHLGSPGKGPLNGCVCVFVSCGWLGSRVVSVLDSAAEQPGFKFQLRHVG